MLGALLVPAYVLAVVAAPLTSRPTRTVVGWEARRLTWVDGARRPDAPRGGQALGFVGVRAGLGLLAGAVLCLIALGLVVACSVVVGATTGGPVSAFDAEPGQVSFATIGWFVLPGVVLLFLAGSGLAGIARLDVAAWQTFARPGADELEATVSRLTVTLADVVTAVDAERRRIERDIHDGVQQRVVALSILLARADRATDLAESQELRRRARAETQHVLDDLRDVSWRIHPTALERDGLGVALEALRDRTSLPVDLRVPTTARFPASVEAAAYFVVSEAITNVMKHAAASTATVSVDDDDGLLRVVVEDDGVGGADPSGPGLSGIAARVAAADGAFHLTSPRGGPTTLEVDLPCA